MSAIVVEDLPRDITLDHQAMAAVEGGGGAPWIYGWITPYAPSEPSVGPVVNLYEVNNNFYAQQMINQFQRREFEHNREPECTEQQPDRLTRVSQAT
jgi:hypothetical protein